MERNINWQFINSRNNECRLTQWNFRIKNNPYQKLSGIRPSGSIESLDSNSSLVLKLPLVNHIRGLLTMFRNYILHGKAWCCHPQLLDRVFMKCGQIKFISLLICYKAKSKLRHYNCSIKSNKNRQGAMIYECAYERPQERVHFVPNPYSTNRTWNIHSPSPIPEFVTNTSNSWCFKCYPSLLKSQSPFTSKPNAVHAPLNWTRPIDRIRENSELAITWKNS